MLSYFCFDVCGLSSFTFFFLLILYNNLKVVKIEKLINKDSDGINKMAADRKLLEAVQQLKQQYAIGSAQALEYVREHSYYEELHRKVKQELGGYKVNITIDDTVNAELLLKHILTTLWNHKLINENDLNCLQEAEKCANAVAIYVHTKTTGNGNGDKVKREASAIIKSLKETTQIDIENMIKNGTTSRDFIEGTIDIRSLLVTETTERDITNHILYGSETCNAYIRKMLKLQGEGDNVRIDEGRDMSRYARAAVEGTLHHTEVQRQIALDVIRANTLDIDSNGFDRLEEVKGWLSGNYRRSGKDEEEFNHEKGKEGTRSVQELVYKILRRTAHYEDRVEYSRKRRQYILTAIEENEHWLIKMLE